ncbi:MAG TPA: hypothetical protein VGF49_17470 [Candidatus Solibacter sp.]
MPTTDQSGIANGDSRPRGGDEAYNLVQRVLWSRCFARSARTRDFLAYVSNRYLENPAADVHEQEIGCAVFGRQVDYDTSADNIVRVNASQLRKKLEVYFATEGAAEPLVILLPKGQYVPVFRERQLPPLEPVAAAPELPDAPPKAWPAKTWVRKTILTMAALAPILAILCVWTTLSLRQVRQRSATRLETSPGINALWSQLIRKDMPTSIVVTDSSLSFMEDLIQRHIPLSEYIHPDRWAKAESLSSNPALQTAAQHAAARHYTSLANVNVARRILSLAGEDQARISIQFARDFSTRQMKSENAILLGSKRANPWVELVEDQLNFRFGFDGAVRKSHFDNRQPRPGELPVYRNDDVTSYCQIALLPNLDRTGRILVISGTEMEGTEVGGEFLTSESWLANLRRVVPLDRNGRFPFFEALLKANKIAGPASGFEIVAVRLPHNEPRP